MRDYVFYKNPVQPELNTGDHPQLVSTDIQHPSFILVDKIIQ